MDSVVVACRTLEKELTCAMEATGRAYPVIYLDAGLHDRPKKLTQVLQEALNTITASRVLLCMGQCGNAMVGIRTGNFQLILPMVDDCLSLLIGSSREKNRLSVQDGAFFMTDGWLQGENTIVRQYWRMAHRYGEEMALELLQTMYAHYRTVGLLDTGVSSMELMRIAAEPMTELLHMDLKEYPATLDYVRQLLTGPYDPERFLIKNPGEVIVLEDFHL